MAKGRSGGRRGGGGGGGHAISTEAMMGYRDNPNMTDSVDETLEVFSEIYDQYGVAVTDIQLAKMDKRGSSTLAYYDMGGNIAFNETFFNSTKMNAVYDASVASGFHPSRGNKTGLQAIAAHELGHRLTAEAAVKMGMSRTDLDRAAKTIMEDARKTGKYKGVIQMGRKISGYATTSNAESISEAFADVFCNGSKANAVSKAVVNSLNKYLGK